MVPGSNPGSDITMSPGVSTGHSSALPCSGTWCRRVFFPCVAFIGRIKKLPWLFDGAELRWEDRTEFWKEEGRQADAMMLLPEIDTG